MQTMLKFTTQSTKAIEMGMKQKQKQKKQEENISSKFNYAAVVLDRQPEEKESNAYIFFANNCYK